MTGMSLVLFVGLEAFAGLDAVEFGHHHVEQDEVGGDVLDALEGLQAIHGDADLVVFGAQHGAEDLDVLLGVVDGEDMAFV